MNFLFLPFNYLAWHYSLALADFLAIWENFFWFFYHFFSLPVLFRTLFAPWKRLGESYKQGFDPGAIISTLIVNGLMRLVGLGARLFVIIAGLLAQVIVFLIGVAGLILWLASPFLVPIFWFLGLYLILT